MTRLALACVLALGGCAELGLGDLDPDNGDDGPDAPSVVGYWALSLNASCGMAMRFDAESKYTIIMVCETGPNTIDLQRERGVYSVEGNSVVTDPMESTCAVASPVVFKIASTRLILEAGSRAYSFDRQSDPPPSNDGDGSAARLGCFGTSPGAAFTERPMLPVP